MLAIEQKAFKYENVILCNSGVLKVFHCIILFSLTVFSALQFYFVINDHYFQGSFILFILSPFLRSLSFIFRYSFWFDVKIHFISGNQLKMKSNKKFKNQKPTKQKKPTSSRTLELGSPHFSTLFILSQFKRNLSLQRYQALLFTLFIACPSPTQG